MLNFTQLYNPKGPDLVMQHPKEETQDLEEIETE